jgi:hypothetical protein
VLLFFLLFLHLFRRTLCFVLTLFSSPPLFFPLSAFRTFPPRLSIFVILLFRCLLSLLAVNKNVHQQKRRGEPKCSLPNWPNGLQRRTIGQCHWQFGSFEGQEGGRNVTLPTSSPLLIKGSSSSVSPLCACPPNGFWERWIFLGGFLPCLSHIIRFVFTCVSPAAGSRQPLLVFFFGGMERLSISANLDVTHKASQKMYLAKEEEAKDEFPIPMGQITPDWPNVHKIIGQ